MKQLNNLLRQTWGTSQKLMLAVCMYFGLATASQAQINLTAVGSSHTENFDAATDFASIQWTTADANGDGAANCSDAGIGRWELIAAPCANGGNNGAAGGTGKAIFYGYKSATGADDWAFSPALQLAAGATYRFTYSYRRASTLYAEKMKVMVTNTNVAANAIAGVPVATALKDYPNITSTAYVVDNITFTPTTAGTFYFAIKAESIADQFFIGIDNVSFLNVPANDISTTAITTTALLTSCASYTATTPFTIRVRNTGTANQTGFPVDWKVRRGNATGTVIASGTENVGALNSNAETTFNVQADLTIGGLYTIEAEAKLTGDAIATNNIFTSLAFNPLSDLATAGKNYGETFDDLNTFGEIGWTRNPSTSDTLGWLPLSDFAICRRNATAANNDWLFSSCFSMTAGQKYRISYQRGKANTNTAVAVSDEKMRFYIGTSASEAGMTTQLLPTGVAAGDEVLTGAASGTVNFTTITIEYTATTTGVHYFGFQQKSDAVPAGYFPSGGIAGIVLNNLSVFAMPNEDMAMKRFSGTIPTICGGYTATTPIQIKAWNSGTAPVAALTAKYRVKDAAGTIIAPEATIPFTAFPVAVNDTITLNFSVDMSLPRYYLIEAYFSGDGAAVNDTIKLAFRNGFRDLTTGPAASYSENFDAPLDVAWTNINAGATGSTTWGLGANPALAASGSNYFFTSTNATVASKAQLFTPCLKLKAGTTYAVKFKYRTNAGADKLKVVLTNANTSAGVTAGTLLKDYPSLLSNNTYTTTGNTDITFTVPTDGNYHIAFEMYSNATATAGTVRIDDFVIDIPAPPAAPTGLTATASTTAKAINLSWTASAGAAGYRVGRSTSMAGPFTDIVTNNTATTYTDADATLQLSPTVYYYQVKAYSLPTLISDASNTANATIVASAPAAAVISATNAASGLRNTITWAAVAGATSYRVERSTTGATGAFTQIGTATSSPYQDNNVVLGATYHYRVFVVNGFNLVSAVSNVASVTVTSLERNTFGGTINVYPNPTREGKIRVEMPETQKTVTFTVLNTMGKEVLVTKGENEKSFEIKTSGLSKGMYFLMIESPKGQATKKIVVE